MTNACQTGFGRRAICLFIAVMLLVPLFTVIAETQYGYVIMDKVLFRKTPTGSDYWAYLNTGWVAEILGKDTAGGYEWYRVKANLPNLTNRNETGYLRVDMCKLMTADEQAAWSVNKPQVFNPSNPGGGAASAGGTLAGSGEAAGSQTATGSSYAQVIAAGANLKQTPSASAPSITAFPLNTIVNVIEAPTPILDWYRVSALGYTGYIAASALKPIASGSAQMGDGAAPQATAVPGAAGTGALQGSSALGQIKLLKGGVNLRSVPGGATLAQLDRGTQLPFYGYTQSGGYAWFYVSSAVGAGYIRSDMAALISGSIPTGNTTPTTSGAAYIRTIKSLVNLRANAYEFAKVLDIVEKRGTAFAVKGAVTNAQGYDWYPVEYNGKSGYLRGDCVKSMTAAEAAAYQPGIIPPGGTGTSTGTGTGPQSTTGYVKTILTSVNIRVSPSMDAGKAGQVLNKGVVFPFYNTLNAGGRLWYKILYNGQVAYVAGYCVKAITNAEGEAAGQSTTSPLPMVTVTPDPATLGSTAVTIMDRALVRAEAGKNARVLTLLYKVGTAVGLTGNKTNADNYTWYQVKVAGVTGFMRGDLLRVMTKAEEAAYLATGNPSAKPTASYRTLQLGATGEDVKRLQQELNRLNYLPVTQITSIYTQETVDAVKTFQKNNGIFVNGIADSATQHKLFNTVPAETYTPGSGDSTVTPTINACEISDWYAGDIATFWTKGETAILTDVATKISYKVKRWSGGYHADVEPLTAADTTAMCKVYKVNNAQEISDKNLYQRHPVWITLKGRTFAASMYGVPHNYPEGDTISDNNFNGQFCVHFYNSRLHRTGVVDKDHMKAIQAAYDAAPVKK